MEVHIEISLYLAIDDKCFSKYVVDEMAKVYDYYTAEL